ncbi:fatty acyl-AMP ligase [Svornostia abyssi]|uniref:Fatty acyl-AMP ligase n=1 Tax=Svornostia abyssi TaxID=2898438 RepID=A0ABY5PDI6_9ACTN|nr:fatty acyl-AMP ligase [Parviterribacteraceae bacterium J379]
MTAGLTPAPARVPDPLADLDGALVTDYLEHWARVQPDAPAQTFTDYLASRQGVTRTITFAELDRWSRAVAAVIMERAQRGDRVAIVCAQSLEYVVAFAATLRAGVIGVPLFSPDMPGHGDRLHGVLADCEPVCLLATTDKLELVRELAGGTDERIVCVDALEGPAGDAAAARFTAPTGISPDDIAYLQYTSGSTRAPAGVELTHGNLLANARQIIEGYDLRYADTNAVSWLPLFHDMGLLIGAPGAIVCGAHAHLMDPLAFLMRPQRWVREMSGKRNVISAAPNFAYGYVAKRMKDEERAELELSGVIALLNGAEPVLPATVDRFLEAFGPVGVRPEACFPSYGLAEATVFVTRSRPGQGPLVREFDAATLQTGRLEPAGAGRSVQLVSCGTAVDSQHVVIVDAERAARMPDGDVGEIWVCGPNVGRAYWQRPDDSVATFGGTLADPGDLPAGPWLKTGDLGAIVDGDLYVTGRHKDLIIVDGRNVYPHDVELSVEQADGAIAAHRLAAFAVPGATGEVVVVVAERHRTAEDAVARLDDIASAARAAVSAEHAVALHDFVLVEPDTIARTSSGKIARHGARAAYLAGELVRVGVAG